jgi:hypothetical protein
MITSLKRGANEKFFHWSSLASCAGRNQTSAILTNRFDRTDGHCLLASRALGFAFRLFADVGIRVLEGAGKVFGSRVATDVVIDARGVNLERAVNVFFYYVVAIRHESADYADFTD